VNRQNAELPEPDFELDETARVVVDAAVEIHRRPRRTDYVLAQILARAERERKAASAGACGSGTGATQSRLTT
jgi:hypothetical protein